MNFGFSMGCGGWFFELILQIAESLQALALVLANPALVDFVDRDGIEVVELFAAMPDGGDEVGLFEKVEVLGHSLAGHVEVRAQGGQRLPVVRVKHVEQLAAAGIGQSFEYSVHDGSKIGN
jgi:hypothetical protein